MANDKKKKAAKKKPSGKKAKPSDKDAAATPDPEENAAPEQADTAATPELEENVELVVMHPMASILNHFESGALKVLGPSIGYRIGGPALRPSEHERRARN